MDPSVPVYAGGGYLYPLNDLARLSDELRAYVHLGFTRAKIKIGASNLAQDEKRIDPAATALSGGTACLAVDAMNPYSLDAGLVASRRLAPLGLWWFEDPCDPFDFETQSAMARTYGGAVAVGEALFSLSERRSCWIDAAASYHLATSSFSIRCTAMASPDISRSLNT